MGGLAAEKVQHGVAERREESIGVNERKLGAANQEDCFSEPESLFDFETEKPLDSITSKSQLGAAGFCHANKPATVVKNIIMHQTSGPGRFPGRAEAARQHPDSSRCGKTTTRH